jgi:hypothetical protein
LTALSTFASDRPLIITEQPDARNESARPKPMPLVLPVMTIFFILTLLSGKLDLSFEFSQELQVCFYFSIEFVCAAFITWNHG